MTQQRDRDQDQQGRNVAQQARNVTQQTRNIEQQDSNVVQSEEQDDVVSLLKKQNTELGTLTAQLRGLKAARWRYRAALIAALVGVLAGGVAIVDNRNQIHRLACLIVASVPDDPARPEIHSFRDRYDCPPFKARASRAGSATPTATVTAQPRPGPTVTATRTATPRRTPGPTRTVVRSGAVRTVPVPGPTRTVTYVPAARTVTVTTRPPCLLPICI